MKTFKEFVNENTTADFIKKYSTPWDPKNKVSKKDWITGSWKDGSTKNIQGKDIFDYDAQLKKLRIQQKEFETNLSRYRMQASTPGVSKKTKESLKHQIKVVKDKLIWNQESQKELKDTFKKQKGDLK